VPSKAPTPSWITVSYRDLIDETRLARTGEPVLQVMGKLQEQPHLKGAAQPFLDRFSLLLQDAVEMLNGPDELPHRSVTRHFPTGTAQPAWVDLLRGRICVTTDNAGHCRVFLRGTYPKAAYESKYSVIRHCLAALTPDDGTPLKLEVYAFRNEYAKGELKLNRRPYVVEAATFPRPANRTPLDLAGLRRFFGKGGVLDGARLESDSGLVLFAGRGKRQTMAGETLSLSDFAVVYRAVFHAGDNEAFISLDPNKDATKVTVNFGGYLEDTRVGSVVLEADKRFKTITGGLDPNSFEDRRSDVRTAVPSFMTCAERDLLLEGSDGREGWIGTRFWFYPESIEVESDLAMEYCRVARARFTADAERSEDDFLSPEAFEKYKSVTLSPSIRTNIDHLNRFYSDYAEVFHEFRELDGVARLFAICSWLEKADRGEADLDALLAVELPPFRTARRKAQHIATSRLRCRKDQLSPDTVKRDSSVRELSPVLDWSCRKFFGDSSGMAEYLCRRDGKDKSQQADYAEEAARLFRDFAEKPVRALITTNVDLRTVAQRAAVSAGPDLPPSMKELVTELEQTGSRLTELKTSLKKLKRRISDDPETRDALIRRYNTLVAENNELVAKLKETREKLETVDEWLHGAFIVSVGGGINLEPDHFTVKKSAGSPELEAFLKRAREAGIDWSPSGGSNLIRSSVGRPRAVPTVGKKIPDCRWTMTKSDRAGKDRVLSAANDRQKRWLSKKSDKGPWRDLTKRGPDNYRERYFDGKNEIRIAVHRRGKVSEIVGRKVASDKIVFTRQAGEKRIPATEPPVWWETDKNDSP